MITDLREDKSIIKDNKNKFNILKFILDNSKYIKYIVLLIILMNILFNPVNTAIVLSDWINNFIGTFLHNIKI